MTPGDLAALSGLFFGLGLAAVALVSVYRIIESL